MWNRSRKEPYIELKSEPKKELTVMQKARAVLGRHVLTPISEDKIQLYFGPESNRYLSSKTGDRIEPLQAVIEAIELHGNISMAELKEGIEYNIKLTNSLDHSCECYDVKPAFITKLASLYKNPEIKEQPESRGCCKIM